MGSCVQGIWKWIAEMYRVGLITAPEFAEALVHRVFFVMQAYLTNGWRVSFTYAAGVMNFWEGMGLVLPSLLQFLADTVFGNFIVALISTIFSSVGIGMVALSVPHILDRNGGRCLKTKAESCLSDTQTAIFYTGLVLTAVGRAGISFSLDALRDDAANANTNADASEQSSRGYCDRLLHAAKEKLLEYARIIDKTFIYVIGSLFIMFSIQKWKLLFGIPAIYSAFMTLQFLSGSCWYRKPRPPGSPLTSVLRIIYAAAMSQTKSQPLIHNQDDYDQKYLGVGFTRCLDRTLTPEGQVPDNKRTFDKEKVDVARFMVGMLPISCTFIFCGIVSSIGNTYFVEQANHMNRRLGKGNAPLLALQLPVICFKAFHDLYLWILFEIYHFLKLKTDLPIFGIGAVAMLYSVLCCVAAAIMEMKRLAVVRNHGLIDKPDSVEVPMHAAWLLIQFFLLAGLDSCLRKSIEELYRAQAPAHLREKLEGNDKSMQRYLNTAVDFVCGLGFWYSVLSVYVVGKVSEIGGNANWFQYTLNRSRLDRYYWVLAGLSSANLVVFILFFRLWYMRRP